MQDKKTYISGKYQADQEIQIISNTGSDDVQSQQIIDQLKGLKDGAIVKLKFLGEAITVNKIVKKYPKLFFHYSIAGMELSDDRFEQVHLIDLDLEVGNIVQVSIFDSEKIGEVTLEGYNEQFFTRIKDDGLRGRFQNAVNTGRANYEKAAARNKSEGLQAQLTQLLTLATGAAALYSIGDYKNPLFAGVAGMNLLCLVSSKFLSVKNANRLRNFCSVANAGIFAYENRDAEIVQDTLSYLEERATLVKESVLSAFGLA